MDKEQNEKELDSDLAIDDEAAEKVAGGSRYRARKGPEVRAETRNR